MTELTREYLLGVMGDADTDDAKLNNVIQALIDAPDVIDDEVTLAGLRALLAPPVDPQVAELQRLIAEANEKLAALMGNRPAEKLIVPAQTLSKSDAEIIAAKRAAFSEDFTKVPLPPRKPSQKAASVTCSILTGPHKGHTWQAKQAPDQMTLGPDEKHGEPIVYVRKGDTLGYAPKDNSWWTPGVLHD